MGMGWKRWTRERLTADELQGYVQDQVVAVFASASARDVKLADPEDGQHVHLLDVRRTMVWDEVGGTWRGVGAQPRAQLYQKTAQTALALGYQTIALDAETVDTHSGHAGGPGYAVPAGHGGPWRIAGTVAFGAIGAGNASGITVGARVLVNGNPLVGNPPILMPVSSTNGCVIPLPEAEFQLAAGDVVTLQGYVNTGGWGTLAPGAADTPGASTSRLTLSRITS